MLVGPVFTREFVTAPRRMRFYVAPAVYVGGLLTLAATAWLLLTGTQQIRNVGDMARFGGTLFQFLTPLQLVLAIFFSAFASASAAAQEKDRRTLVLLLLTNLSNSELVLGKLFASLLNVLMLLAAALPFFMLTMLFGGVGLNQILAVFAVTVVTAIAAGSLGSTIALWREKTFQTLALTALALGVLAAWEVVVASGTLPQDEWQGTPLSHWAVGLSPWQALVAATKPRVTGGQVFPIFGSPLVMYLAASSAFAAVVNLIAIARVRVWNPSREARPRTEETDEFRSASPASATTTNLGENAELVELPTRSVHAAPGKQRQVWDNPILWREVCTWAYGRRIMVMRFGYLALFAAAVFSVHTALQPGAAAGTNLSLAVIPLFLLSLVLVNALAVTSITTERDLGALDLLLVTDVSPAEFIFGKLGGVFYVSKEFVILPLALAGYMWWCGALPLEHLIYLLGGLLLMNVFVATLGIHTGLAYTNSRNAVAVSLGTVFFLFVGVATCMRIMISFSGSFQLQLAPFLALMIGGSTGLFVALGSRNPSQAIGLASLLLPALTFVAITSYLQGQSLGVFLVVAFTYGLTTAAMLVPAISEFDVATGRTTE
jgi:ABC-type transport system involved in multi-copper enzyme maturation permease subunit